MPSGSWRNGLSSTFLASFCVGKQWEGVLCTLAEQWACVKEVTHWCAVYKVIFRFFFLLIVCYFLPLQGSAKSTPQPRREPRSTKRLKLAKPPEKKKKVDKTNWFDTDNVFGFHPEDWCLLCQLLDWAWGCIRTYSRTEITVSLIFYKMHYSSNKLLEWYSHLKLATVNCYQLTELTYEILQT